MTYRWLWVPMGLTGLVIYANFGAVAAGLSLLYGILCMLFTVLYFHEQDHDDA